jgi:hypothetical protein
MISSLNLTADAFKPLDDPADGFTYVVPLSKWKRTEAGWSFECLPRPELFQHGIVGG